MSRFLLCVVVVIPLGCSGPVQPDDVEGAPTQGQTEQGKQVGGTPQFNERLLEIASSYENYGLVAPAVREAVMACVKVIDPSLVGRQGPSPLAPEPRYSTGGDSATHGRKLYWLFVKEWPEGGSYVLPGRPNPIGQAVVKEAWTAKEVKDDDKPPETLRRKAKLRQGDKFVEAVTSFLPDAKRDGHLYRATRKSALFIMYKVDPTTPGTDEGWVYGTVSADGKQVTSAGRVESCMRCHQKAPHDRLFGLPKE
jgi:hypothetical protein